MRNLRIPLSLEELWNKKDGFAEEFSSLQVFSNSAKKFEPFLFFIDLSLGRDKVDTKCKFWKKRIAYNSDEEEELSEGDGEFKAAILKGLMQISNILKKVNTNYIRHLISSFVVSYGRIFGIPPIGTQIEAWLVGYEELNDLTPIKDSPYPIKEIKIKKQQGMIKRMLRVRSEMKGPMKNPNVERNSFLKSNTGVNEDAKSSIKGKFQYYLARKRCRQKC